MAFEPKQFGRFYLLEKLAVGGMAEIYKAKTYGAEGFEKLLAIKRILPHCSADKDFITMLIDEAKLSVLLSHANIVQVYDLGKVGEDFFISMEYINGINLRDILYRCREQKKSLPPELAVYIISEICKGLDYAHRKTDANGKPLNIVHRDVSPQNILISFEGEVKLVDFGIAKAAMNISHTMAGILKGKIAYMSPEQALGKTIDYRTDLFSAGIILFECLTGKKLFTGESQFEVLKKIRTTKISTEALPNTLDPQLRTILARALCYFPKDRHQNAGDLQSELTRFLYSTYVDFTPQRLAAFVRDLFSDELTRQQQEAIARHQREQQTSSMALAQEAAQEDIVHRPEITGGAMPEPPEGTPSPVPLPPERAVAQVEGASHRFRTRIAQVVGLVAVLTATVVGYTQWIHPILFRPSTPAALGTIRIASSPTAAEIYLNGARMNQQTPALIRNLQLGASYTISLAKPGYLDSSQTITPRTATPVGIEMALREATGTLVVNSEPSGAPIFLNGNPTQHVTPATISDLALDQPMRVTLKKEGYVAEEREITLTSIEPEDLVASLIPKPGELKPTTPLEEPTTPSTLSAMPAVPSAPEIAAPAEAPATTLEPTNAVATHGTIRVKTDPAGATIYLNGKRIDKVTPALLSDLTPGEKYTVRVAKQGYTGWARTITLRSEKEVLLSQALTKPLDSKPTPTKEVASRQPAEQPTTPTVKIETVDRKGSASLERTTTTPPSPIKTGKASVTIRSKPKGATVFIGGRSVGRTPLTIRGLASGSPHALRVVLKGYDPWSTSLNLEPGKERVVNAPLQRAQ